MSPIMLVLPIFLFLIINPTRGQEEVKKKAESAATTLDKETLSEMERMRAEPRISSDFSRGAYLIFDCRNRYYACVNQPSFDSCRLMRDKGYQAKKKILPCAPLKEFSDQKDCFAKQYSLIHHQKPKAFCQNTKNAKY